jgi:competence protein ComEC
MWLGMLASAAAQASPALAVPLDALNAPLLAFVGAVAHAAARAPLAVTEVHLGSPTTLALAYVLLAAGLAALRAAGRRERGRGAAGVRRRASPQQRAALVAAAALVLVAAAITVARSGPAPPAPGELVVSFMDVGQGDATLLQLDGASVLFDTGPPDGPILGRLHAAGVRQLDALVLTHAESDHEGAALPIVERYRPRLVLDGGAGWRTPVQRELGPAARTVGSTVTAAHAGQTLTLGRLRVRMLWPPPPTPGVVPGGNPNDRAVVAVASLGAFDLLLPADVESAVTLPLDLPPVEALKVAHHGSADDGLALLLRRLRPQVAAIEVGRRNTYGHPAASTLSVLSTVPRLVRTDRDGTVRLHVRGGAMTLERLGRGR